ncbi:MAG TPA: CAP domain-containing protein [Candidatus Limnocylindrales bacterium]|nr:CAP domain-containing protein [Candidatus Limnocylindrales bacterium]
MTSMPSARRLNRVVALAFVALLVGAFAVPAQVGAVETMTVSSAELAMVNALNADRTAVGLVPVRIDTRLMSIARARSADMVAKDYFSHTQPDGRNVFAILTAQHVTWYNAGEIIAWNMYASLQDSVDGGNYQWMHSSGHKAIIVSTDFNYVGVGLAISSTGKKVWTAVYIKGPDRTGARATTALPTVTAGTTSATKRVSVNWSGSDVRLQVLTSGFYSYQVQRRTDGGAWTTVWSSTTLKSATFNLPVNHTYEFRVAARDKAGNWGAWSTVTTSLAAPVGAVIINR